MKRTALLAVCALALVSTSASAYWARSWWSINGYTLPGVPVAGDSVSIHAYGTWSADCVPDVSQVEIDGNVIHVDIFDAYASDYCFGVETDFDLGALAGVLAPGAYDVYVWQWSYDAFTFDPGFYYVRGPEYLMSFTVQSARIPGDATGDGHVNIFDLLMLADAWNTCAGDALYSAACDFTGDNCVNIFDLLILADHWNT